MIRLDSIRYYRSRPPVEKLLTMVFGMIGADRADWIRFDFRPQPRAVWMWFLAQGTYYQMVSPPAGIWPDLVRTLWQNTRFSSAPRRRWWDRWRADVPFPELPAWGAVPIHFQSGTVPLDILFFRGLTCEHIWIDMPRSVDLVTPSRWFFEQWREEWGDNFGVELPSDDSPDDPGVPPGLVPDRDPPPQPVV